MAKPLVTDELWALVEPLLPAEAPKPKGGRPRINNHAVLSGILFVLRSGIPWEMLPGEMLPREMGCRSGMTCWRRLRDWQQAGVWQQLHPLLLERLHAAGEIDWSRACLDSASVPTKGGGAASGPNPTDRGKAGSKRHLIVDRQGIPLAIRQSGANLHDSRMLEKDAGGDG